MKTHHIGIITKNIQKSINIYVKLGYTQLSPIYFDENQNNHVAFLQDSEKRQTIELISAANKSSTIYNTPEGYHHICYEIDDKNDFFNTFKDMKIGKIFTPPQKAPAINNREIVFACLTNSTFIEFLF